LNYFANLYFLMHSPPTLLSSQCLISFYSLVKTVMKLREHSKAITEETPRTVLNTLTFDADGIFHSFSFDLKVKKIFFLFIYLFYYKVL
jgi:hypothetical protein